MHFAIRDLGYFADLSACCHKTPTDLHVRWINCHANPPYLQSSSASRFTAGASEFFILSQSGERPER
jgi:hypothetical protein